MSGAADLLTRCRTLDIHLRVESGRLLFDAPRGAFDADLRAELVEHKAELIELLASPPPALVKPSEAPTAAELNPLDRLTRCHRTPWGTWCWSDPAEPVIESFGAAPRLAPPSCDPAREPALPATARVRTRTRAHEPRENQSRSLLEDF
jgi:hypothetical protein